MLFKKIVNIDYTLFFLNYQSPLGGYYGSIEKGMQLE